MDQEVRKNKRVKQKTRKQTDTYDNGASKTRMEYIEVNDSGQNRYSRGRKNCFYNFLRFFKIFFGQISHKGNTLKSTNKS